MFRRRLLPSSSVVCDALTIRKSLQTFRRDLLTLLCLGCIELWKWTRLAVPKCH